MEILIPALVIAVIVIVALVLKNQALSRQLSRHRWNEIVAGQSLPQAARAVALPDVPMIKMSNFENARRQHEEQVAELRKQLGAALRREGEARSQVGHWMRVAQERGVELNRLKDVAAQLAESEAERKRVAGLYQTAETHRQRLALENARLKEADITPGESFAAIPMRIGTGDKN